MNIINTELVNTALVNTDLLGHVIELGKANSLIVTILFGVVGVLTIIFSYRLICGKNER